MISTEHTYSSAMNDYKYHRVEQNGGKSTFQYFAYGSNMLEERIHLKNPTAKLSGIGKLYGFKLTFEEQIDMPPSKWLGAAATIRPTESQDYIYGVIWNIKTEYISYLDRQESSYEPLQVDVVLDGGEITSCRTYEMQENTLRKLPSPQYKRVIIAGAKQHGLPEDYIQQLERFPDNGQEVVPLNYLQVIELVTKNKLAKEKNGQITALDYQIERELMNLVQA